ncbi:MAG: GC-type dockerin domain-anchored protein [Phycisphaerales bacterium]
MGENLEAICRDSGSGTRNSFMNGIGLDPSFGAGENVGDRATSDSTSDKVGPHYQPSSKSGSSRMDATVLNVRLGVGHTGAQRGVSSGWLINHRMNILGITADIKGGNVAVRPTEDSTNDGGANSWNIFGPSSISTRGDFRSVAPELGGWGWDPAEVGPMPADFGPPCPNAEAGAFVNNIRRSVAEFVMVPGGDPTAFMPGERLAQLYLLPASPTFAPQINPATAMQPIPIIANPSYNVNVHNYSLNDPANVFANAEYDSFDFAATGTVPTRETGPTYSDGVAGGTHYVKQSGATISYGGDNTMPRRNKIAYDFNGDGLRTAADAMDMLRAIIDREGGAAWVAPSGSGALLDITGDGIADGGVTAPGTDACPEILGDGNSDGSFTREDVRYWADGLVLEDNGLDILPVFGVDSRGTDGIIDTFVVGDGMNDKTLDRKAGFEAVDNAWMSLMGDNNFFGTQIGDGSIAYTTGASRADVAGAVGTTRGWAPTGHDGVVDHDDVDYIIANFGDWTDLSQAVNIDLSCDMNGDLVIDQADVDYVLGLLGELGCNAADLAVPYGTLNFDDVVSFLTAFGSMDAAADLAVPFGVFNFDDVVSFLSAFGAGCP